MDDSDHTLLPTGGLWPDEPGPTLIQLEGEPPQPSDEAGGEERQTSAKTSDNNLRALIYNTVTRLSTDTIDISRFNVSVDELQSIYKSLIQSSPELFYVYPYPSVSYYVPSQAVWFTPSYRLSELGITRDQLPGMQASLRAQIADVMAWVPAGGTTLEKVKAVHDWFVRHIRYDYDAYNSSHYAWYDHHMYGALVYHKCVCAGYADAFQLIMDLLGIPCTTVSAHNHAWNRVNVDGNWYHVDTTWDENLTNDSLPATSSVCATYFLKSDGRVQQIDAQREGHVTHADYRSSEVPSCTTYYDWYNDWDWPNYAGWAGSNYAGGFSLTYSSLTLGTLQRKPLGIWNYTPYNLNTKMAQWTSSNPSVAGVSMDGTVWTGTSRGKATITCDVAGIQRSCTVYVKADLQDATVAYISAKRYTGKDIVPQPKVTYGGTVLKRNQDYTLRFYNNRNVGTATIVISGKGYFTGTRKVRFKIARKKVTPKVSLSKKSFVYNGKRQRPKVTVKVGKRTLKKSEYTLKWPKNTTAVGVHKVKVALKGNLSGTKTVSYKIRPKATKIARVVTGDGALTVRWKSLPGKVSGYQVQYSRNSSFKGAKTVTIRGSKKIRKRIGRLASWEYYYVRVRTYKKVGKKAYHSSWSSAKGIWVW